MLRAIPLEPVKFQLPQPTFGDYLIELRINIARIEPGSFNRIRHEGKIHNGIKGFVDEE